tara:strand:- start:12905 stop:15319 length:2415 start_codon:yes stop_codon:yes gene_type:complete
MQGSPAFKGSLMMTWNPRLWLCLPVLAALVVSALAAQPPDDGDGFEPRFGPPPDPLSFALDTDRDGEISAAEMRRAPEILRGLDRDRNGTLTLEELLPRFPGPPGSRPGRGMGPNRPQIQLAAEFDQDANGYLDADERKLALAALADRGGSGRGGRGPGGRRGGEFGRTRGPGGGRGPAREPGRPGPKVTLEEADHYPDASLYEPAVLRTIFIEFDTDDWESQMADFKHTDVAMPATVIVDGTSFPLVGLRFRGQSSFGHVPAGSKRSLNLTMDLVHKDQRLYGYKTLNLLNSSGDPSMLSSVLYSLVAQDYLPVPKANFVKVVINGESWGIYCNVQQFNTDFLHENYGVMVGARWKVPGSPGADGGLRDLGDELDPYRQRFEIKSKDRHDSWLALVNLCRVLNETPTEQLPEAIEPILNVDGLLRFLALDVALVNGDGYWTRASDYSIYRDPTGVFHIIPHDMNEAFQAPHGGGRRGGRGGPGGRGFPPGFGGPPGGRDGRGFPPEGGRGFPGSFGGSGGHELDPLVGLDSPRMPLRSRILAVPAYRQQYLHYLRALAEVSLHSDRLAPVIARYRALLADELAADTRKLSSLDAFLAATAPSADRPPANSPSLLEFIGQRRNFLLTHDAIRDLNTIPVRPPAEHISIKPNDGTAATVAISEFLAANTKSNRDPQDELEDWLELTNYGETAVDLSGMYLSDDPTNPFKWEIPENTVIAAGSYLVIWADEDGADEGLHANFKLSRSGEVITLTAGRMLVDRVEFGEQFPDVSQGRFPERTSPLRPLNPTPGEPNRSLDERGQRDD